jgi:lysophospholipase L1-like esterase
MSDKIVTGGVRYLDMVVVAAAVLVTASVVLNPGGRSWINPDTWILVLFGAVCAGFAIFRRQIYRHSPTSWLIMVFLAVLGLAMFRALWAVPLMWFLVLAGVASLVLLVGLIAPLKPIREHVTRTEAFKLTAVVCTVVLMIGVAELFVRLADGIFPEETRQLLSSTPANSGLPHPYIGHLQRPNRTMVFTGRDFKASHKVDAVGFRNRWPWPERADIVAIGDSLTFGLGVDDDREWPSIVAHATGREVINLGLVGASPEQYFRVYQTFGAAVRPKLLLVGVYAQNDFWDAAMFDQWLREGVGDNYMVWRDFGRPRRFTFSLRRPIATAEGVFRAHIYPVVRSSHLYNLVRGIRGGTGGIAHAWTTLSFADGSRLQLSKDEFVFMTAGAQPDRPEFRLVLDALRKIQSFAKEQGTRTLVILQPSKEEVYLPLMGEPVTDPTGPLRQALDEAGLEYLDLQPVFRQRAKAGERLFFEIDSHPNEAGYRLIGQSVAAQIHQNAGSYGLGQ